MNPRWSFDLSIMSILLTNFKKSFSFFPFEARFNYNYRESQSDDDPDDMHWLMFYFKFIKIKDSIAYWQNEYSYLGEYQ